jgi:hypothetical protein
VFALTCDVSPGTDVIVQLNLRLCGEQLAKQLRM